MQTEQEVYMTLSSVARHQINQLLLYCKKIVAFIIFELQHLSIQITGNISY